MPAHGITPKQIFDHAHEITSLSERKSYLDQACAGDREFRQRMEELLKAHDEMDSHFLSSPNRVPALTVDLTSAYTPAEDTPQGFAETPHSTDRPPISPHDENDDWVGKEVGPYKLLKKLGKGGMGLVYLAEQEKPIRRKVALKFILPGKDTAHVLARFDVERQALSMMDHVSIAKVLDAGTTAAGQPYYVMELIAGKSLIDYCNEEKLMIRERLEMFVTICQAVQHAHQRGIIHRDLKPTNILVTVKDSKPIAKIIDFGLAKATEEKITEHSELTQVGDIVGTWRYMSPEQAEGGIRGIDTRTDIYSLGVILYEFLTGTTVIEGTRAMEFLQKVKDENRQRPSARVGELGNRLTAIAAERKIHPAQLARLLRGELDWIALKAVEMNRDRRYESAGELAGDVQRYLDDEPVKACPPSARYRIGKFVRRNRLFVTAVTLVIAALSVGAIGLSIGLVRANAAEANERDAMDQAVKDRDLAVRAQLIQEAALRITRSGIRAQIYDGNVPGEKEKVIFSRMLEGFEQLIALLSTGPQPSPLERMIIADEEFQAANINHLLRKYVEAGVHYQKAIDHYEELVRDVPAEQKYRNELARCNFDYAHLMLDLKKRVEAEHSFRRSIFVFKQVIADFPTEASYRCELANAYNDLGVLFRINKNLKEAEKLFREAIAIHERIKEEEPNDLNYQIKLSGSYENLGNAVRDQGNLQEAVDWYGKATPILKPIAYGTSRFNINAAKCLRDVCWDRANARGQLGLYPKAIADWKGAIEVQDQLERKFGEAPGKEHLRKFLAAAEMEVQLAANTQQAPSFLYQAATTNALALTAAIEKEEESLQKQYIKRAFEVLEKAKKTGWFDDPLAIKRLQDDKQFQHLIQTDEFRTFLKDLALKKKTKDQVEKK